MKLFLKSVRAQKKIIIIFLFAILMPLGTAVYLSFDTFFARQQSTRRLLESNLWIYSKSALNQIENELIKIEDVILNNQILQKKITSDTAIVRQYSNRKKDSVKKFYTVFLLDQKFNIVYPLTGKVERKNFTDNIKVTNLKFDRVFKEAEILEFYKKNYNGAIKKYSECFSIAVNIKEKAFALEPIGRLQYFLKNYSLANKAYNLLYEKYPKVINKVGHPFGLISILQLNEINKSQGTNTDLIPLFFDAYEKLKDGYWHINQASYEYFISEIELLLESKISQIKDARIIKQYELLSDKPSLYLQDLNFVKLLSTKVIKKIEEKALITNDESITESKRILIIDGDKLCLVSYKEFTDYENNETYVVGFRWVMDSLRKNIIPPILLNLSNNSGMEYFITEDENIENITKVNPENSLTLSFNKFPIPWKLIIVQPALLNLKKEVNKEMLISGLFLTILIVFMFMGVFLLVRDYKRESDSMKVKTEFIHNVSHELKTPLSLIRLYGETLMMKEHLDGEDKKNALQVITKESERLSHMINNILDFSKIEMGEKEFHFKEGNIANVITDTFDSYRYHLEKKGFVISKEIEQDIPRMKFDKEAIEGLLINIFSNAVKYSDNEKFLSLKVKLISNVVSIQILDKGIGIPQEEMPYIFERFYRSKQQSDHEVKGSGLGLTLVKHVVDSHGGTIKVQSELGVGTTFSIQFPIQKSPVGGV